MGLSLSNVIDQAQQQLMSDDNDNLMPGF